MNRHLEWEGCYNARDLGLPSRFGRIQPGAFVRADSVNTLTERGWSALFDHGVRTIIDLRNTDELKEDRSARPAGLSTLHLPHDNSEDKPFWDVWGTGPQFGTPMYYSAHLTRFPERSARVLQAIANAKPKGVLFHCSVGRDRSGLISILLLHLLGVSLSDIVADYELSIPRLRPLLSKRGEADHEQKIAEYLAAKKTSFSNIIKALVGSGDLEKRLGLDPEVVERLKVRGFEC